MELDIGNGEFNDVPKYNKKSVTEDETIHVYTSGDYDKELNRFGYGVVITQNDEVIKKLQGTSNHKSYIGSKNIAGEIFATLYGIQWAINHHYKKVIVHYNFEGIEKWANREWDAKKDISSDYVHSFFMYSKEIYIEFVKAEGRYARIAKAISSVQ